MPSIRIPLAFLLGAALATAWAEDGEATVTIDQVPKAVKEAILKAANGATVAEIEKQTLKGKVVYEASWVAKDAKAETEILIAEDGTVLKSSQEEEHGEKGEKGEKGEHAGHEKSEKNEKK